MLMCVCAAAAVLYICHCRVACDARSLAREDNLLESLLIGVRGLLLRWIYAATVLRGATP
jgi:hypothetical protein